MEFFPAAFRQQPASDALRNLESRLNSKLEAVVISVSGDGSMVLQVEGLKSPITVAADLPVSEGDLVGIVLRRAPGGGMTLELVSAVSAGRATAQELDLFIEGKIGRLLSEFLNPAEQKGAADQETVRRFQEALIRLLSAPRTELPDAPFPASGTPSVPTPEPGRVDLPVREIPAAGKPVVLPNELNPPSPPSLKVKTASVPFPPAEPGTAILPKSFSGAASSAPVPQQQKADILVREFLTALRLLEADPQVPPALKALLPAMVESLKTQVPLLRETPMMHPLQIVRGEKPLLEVLEHGPRTVTVEKALRNGHVRLSAAGVRANVEALPPFPLKPGSTWTLSREADGRIVLSGTPEPAKIPERIANLVRRIAAEAGLPETAAPVKGKAAPLPPALAEIAARIDRLGEALRLSPEDEQSLGRSFLFLSDKGEAGRSVRPELALYPALKGFGESLAELITRLESASTAPDPELRKAVEDLLKTLSTRFALPLLSHEGEGRGRALKQLLEEGGQFFENRLFRALASDEKSAAAAEKDLKAILNKVAQLIDDMDVVPQQKERLHQDTGKLLQSLDSLQVRAMAENDTHHILVPFVQSGEVHSAYVAVKKRTGRKRIDPENAALTLRVSPSALGDVEGRVEIRQGRLDVHFILEKEKFARLFESSKKELTAHVERAGYALGQVRTSLFRGQPRDPAGGAPEAERPAGGFDVTV